MSKHIEPGFNRLSAAAWNAIIPEEDESVFTKTVYHLDMNVKEALQAGAILSPQGQTKGNALIYAVWMRNFGLLRLLLKNGFDPNDVAFTAKGEHPSTALDAVANCYHDGDGKVDEMVLDAMHELLREYGAKYISEMEASGECQRNQPTENSHGSSDAKTPQPTKNQKA